MAAPEPRRTAGALVGLTRFLAIPILSAVLLALARAKAAEYGKHLPRKDL
jgi:hypothetical protein